MAHTERPRAAKQAYRDWRDTVTGAVWFQVLAAILSAAAAAYAAVSASQASAQDSKFEIAMWAVVGAIGGYVCTAILVYLRAWAMAPYRQRDAAWDEVDSGLDEIERLTNTKPILSLGDPESLDKEWLLTPELAGGNSRFGLVEAQMVRIPLHNAGPYCEKVTARVARSTPPFPDAPGMAPIFTLHLPKSSQRYFELAEGDDVFLDFIGYSTFASNSFWLANINGRDGFVSYEEDGFSDKMRRVTVEALGGGMRTSRDYAVWMNQGILDVTTWEDYMIQSTQWQTDVKASGLSQEEYIAKLFADRDAEDDPAEGPNRSATDEAASSPPARSPECHE